jgi:hypothetical protein
MGHPAHGTPQRPCSWESLCPGIRFHWYRWQIHDVRSTPKVWKTISIVRSERCFQSPGASRSVKFLGQADKKPFRPADVAEPIRILILDYFAHELGAALAKPVKRFVDVVNREHDAEIA